MKRNHGQSVKRKAIGRPKDGEGSVVIFRPLMEGPEDQVGVLEAGSESCRFQFSCCLIVRLLVRRRIPRTYQGKM